MSPLISDSSSTQDSNNKKILLHTPPPEAPAAINISPISDSSYHIKSPFLGDIIKEKDYDKNDQLWSFGEDCQKEKTLISPKKLFDSSNKGEFDDPDDQDIHMLLSSSSSSSFTHINHDLASSGLKDEEIDDELTDEKPKQYRTSFPITNRKLKEGKKEEEGEVLSPVSPSSSSCLCGSISSHYTLPIPENQTLLPHKSQAIVQPKATRIPLCRLLCYMQVPIGFLPATPPMRHHMSYSTKLQIHNDRNPAKRKEYRLSRSSKARYPDKIPVLGASAPTPTPILTESYRRRLRESVDHLCEKQLERASLGLHSLGSSQESPVKPQSIIRIVPNTSSSSLFSKTNHISKKGQRKKLHKKYLP
ncbi:hypothetical protein ADUPG1_006854, partial [Aduncisulcus paluster]